ncbi:hypothetical protein IJZ97_05620, partial [bacterium]|nr:hypothetical protein [bacterium]
DDSGNTTDADDLKFMSDYGIKYCHNDSSGDYWAGAAELCGGTSKMASMADLAKIADYVYNTSGTGAHDNVYDLTFDPTKAAELGLPSPTFYLWSGEEDDSYYAYIREFSPGFTGWTNYGRNGYDLLAVCLGN